MQPPFFVSQEASKRNLCAALDIAVPYEIDLSTQGANRLVFSGY